MHTSETVSYVLKDHNFREVSKGRGVLDYHLVDEFGNKRTVSARASMGWNKKIKSIHPLVPRETPLVEALAQTAINETITVDFSEFNKKFPRGSIRSKSMKVRKVKAIDPNSAISNINSISLQKVRLMKLIGIAVAGFATMAYFITG
jgi:hypothetical protein